MTLHSYNLIWAVCHLFPRQIWRTHTYSVSGNHCPGEPRDLRKTTPRVNFVLRLEPLPRHVFSINTSSSNTLPLFTQILRSGYTLSLRCDILLIHQQVWKAKRKKKWISLADIHFFNIHWLWDFFQSQRKRLFRITKRKTFKYVIQPNRTFPSLTFL